MSIDQERTQNRHALTSESQQIQVKLACVVVMMSCLPVIVAQMQVNTQVRMGPSGAGSMRYPQYQVQQRMLPSEARGGALASGMMPSEHRYERSVAGNLPSAGRYSYLTPSMSNYNKSYAFRPGTNSYGTLRHSSSTAYGQSLPWRQQSYVAKSALTPKAPAGSVYTSPYKTRSTRLGSSGYGTLSYRR
jgi:hypothetical protein